jgi:hydroxymethylpyrimidine/phosphomethylpyrimidine kinase
MRMSRTPRVLSIAGSDSGGGAGIQADLKAFAAAGVHGMTAITAITAQNTVGVTAVHPIPPHIIIEQVRAIADDIGVDAVKIGMLGNQPTIEAVAQALKLIPDAPVVIDPVMVSESGARLLDEHAVGELRDLLMRRAMVVTPNVPEALVLVGGDEQQDPAHLAEEIHLLGPKVVVVTGGHRTEAVDTFYDGTQLVEIPGPRHEDGAAHGSGCTHSSTLAAWLAKGASPLEAAQKAKDAASEAVRNGLRDIGQGPGPVHVLGPTSGLS